MIESITSYLFSKVADFTFSSLMKKLDIKDKKDKKKIEKAIKDFKKYLTDRHIENPYYEDVISLWEEYQVCEELLKICYKRYRSDSKFKSYSEFKEYLSEKFEGRTDVKDFSNNLMDELEKYLSDTVKDTSNFTQADMAAMHSIITEPIINEIHKLPENNSSFTQRVPENNKTTRQQLEQVQTQKIVLNIVGGFEKGSRNEYKIENFEEVRDLVSEAIINRDFKSLRLQNKQAYKKEYAEIKEYFHSLNNTNENYGDWELGLMQAEKHIRSVDEMLKEICKCIRLYFESDVFFSSVILTPTDFKNLVEAMLNRTAINIEDKKYKFFIPDNYLIDFNVYLSEKDISYINVYDEQILLFARFGGVPILIDTFNKSTQIKIIAELLLKLIKIDREKLDRKYYQIGNYYISEG